jgi:hypothetical protein
VSKTLTIRLPPEQDEALTRRAAALGRTRSALVRELIERGLQNPPLGRRIGHLKGRLDLPRPAGGWRRQIKERNWR